MDAKAALASYRQRVAGPNMAKALESFEALSERDRLELLFWMIMATNNQMMTVLKTLNIDFKVNVEPDKGN